ncbi:PIR Superfamily Protein [Plasmodium ovale wallikeri]|uniref:PIR Superfamily Protein n=1 Tax=Plasmodium ovale wallikeri TaxID=864142 RepID=A0A1A9ANL8_PLAOA|nr:PIR Superfamily Protein [Plasmodium ovale wallikeri]SBT58264.1 PIR Superfamily Protein [Plasmodium ovale wallikeri]
MTNGIHINDLPSKKYNNELNGQIHYKEIVENIESETFTPEDIFWLTTLPKYLEEYINTYVDMWSYSNESKRCRDLNNKLDSIIKRVKNKETYNESYDLIINYINNSATNHLRVNTLECKRESKLPEYSDDIENMKNIDDLCEDIVYVDKNFSEINSDHCKEIQNYISQRITSLKEIYIYSYEKYSHILKYYDFTTFDDLDSITGRLKSKCQDAKGALLTGGQSEMSQYSGRNASIIAVTSLSGILSSFFLLYKTTSFGSILNNLVGKKMKFGNNLSDEAYYETLEDISESSHDGTYNILYNSVGDS